MKELIIEHFETMLQNFINDLELARPDMKPFFDCFISLYFGVNYGLFVTK